MIHVVTSPFVADSSALASILQAYFIPWTYIYIYITWLQSCVYDSHKPVYGMTVS